MYTFVLVVGYMTFLKLFESTYMVDFEETIVEIRKINMQIKYWNPPKKIKTKNIIKLKKYFFSFFPNITLQLRSYQCPDVYRHNNINLKACSWFC